MKDRTAGLVYYVLDASRFELRVKIGSTTNLSERLKSLARQTMSRQQPLVLALEDGGEQREFERHQQFGEDRDAAAVLDLIKGVSPCVYLRNPL